MFSVSITHHSKIRELSDGNKNWKQIQTEFFFFFFTYDPHILSYEWWIQSYELWQQQIQTAPNALTYNGSLLGWTSSWPASWDRLKDGLHQLGLLVKVHASIPEESPLTTFGSLYICSRMTSDNIKQYWLIITYKTKLTS